MFLGNLQLFENNIEWLSLYLPELVTSTLAQKAIFESHCYYYYLKGISACGKLRKLLTKRCSEEWHNVDILKRNIAFTLNHKSVNLSPSTQMFGEQDVNHCF